MSSQSLSNYYIKPTSNNSTIFINENKSDYESPKMNIQTLSVAFISFANQFFNDCIHFIDTIHNTEKVNISNQKVSCSEILQSSSTSRGVIMDNKVSQQVFDQFEKRVEDKLDGIQKDLRKLMDISYDFATKTQLEQTEKKFTYEIEKARLNIRNWLLGVAVTVLLSIIYFSITNPEVAIRVLELFR